MGNLDIWPAIDLRGGKCVRLRQGDFRRETVFGEDPAAVARAWVQQGAERLHLVDLDGARDGRPANLPSVRAILAIVDVPAELGGGIRSAEVVDELLDLGLRRLVIGTRALKEPEWFERLCRRQPGKLVLGLDARDGYVATEGWLETSRTPAAELVRRFESLPLAAIVYTDIGRDGMMAGPNFEAIDAMQQATDIPLVASGGVSSADDVIRLARMGLAGAIIGRALYEGTLTLADALAAASG